MGTQIEIDADIRDAQFGRRARTGMQKNFWSSKLHQAGFLPLTFVVSQAVTLTQQCLLDGVRDPVHARACKPDVGGSGRRCCPPVIKQEGIKRRLYK